MIAEHFPYLREASAPWLVTGFTPFAEHDVNPSGQTALALDGQEIAGRRVIGMALPVTGEEAWEQTARVLADCRPAAVLALGVSGRSSFSVETTAWNWMDYPIPDHAGHQWQQEPIHAHGPDRLFTTLPVRIVARRLSLASLPVDVSQDPGRYVCNHFYYRLLQSETPSLFLHGPTYSALGPLGQEAWLHAATEALRAVAGDIGLVGEAQNGTEEHSIP